PLAFLSLVEPWPFCRTIMSHRASGRLAHELRIFRERACPMPRRTRLPGLASLGKLALVDAQVHAPRSSIDLDAVAVSHQRQRPTDEGFRRDIADAHASRRTRETAIGDECDLLAHALSIDQGGDAEHFPHAGTADRPLVTDHEHLARGVGAVAHGLDAMFLVLEHTRHTLKYKALPPRDLDDRPVGAEIALQHRHAAIRHDRLADREDDLTVRRVGTTIFFCKRPARDRHTSPVDMPAF